MKRFRDTLGSILLAGWAAQAKYVKFNVYDSIEMPNEYADGVNAFVKITSEYKSATSSDQWLLCTSCTFSYMFSANPPTGYYSYTFKEGAKAVPYDFDSVNMSMTDADGTVHTWQ